MRNIKFIIIIIVITIIFGPRKAAAQSISLSISPPLLEVIIKPGKSITQVYKITNNGEPVVVTPKLFELGATGVKEDPDFVRDKWISMISNDIDFDKPFLLGSGKEAEFLIRINPPTGTTEADYYRALVFATNPQPPTDTTMSSFAQNLASPILVTVTSTGVFAKGAQITKFDLPTIIDSFDPLVADMEVKNTGKVYFRPVGKITLTGPIGRGNYDLTPNVILSDQNRQLLTEHLPPADQDTKTLYLPGFYIGKYKLDLNFSLDEGTTKMSQAKTFYAFPWKAGLILTFIVLFVIMRLKRRKNK